MPASTCSKSTRSVTTAFSTFRKSSQSATKQRQPLSKPQTTLFSSNMGLVHHVAHRFEWTGEDYEDLAQIGAIGLMTAIKKFNASKGYAFSSYAIRCITGEIMHYLRDHGSMVRIPRRWRELRSTAKRIAKTCNGMTAEKTIAKIIEELAISKEEWMRIEEAHANQYHSSLEEVVVGEEADESDGKSEQHDTPEIASAKIRARISHLPKTEYAIAEMLVKGSSHADITTRLGLTVGEFNRRLRTVRLSLEEKRA